MGSLDGYLAIARVGWPAGPGWPGACGRRRRGDPVFVNEHQRRDQLALSVEQVDLRRGRHHLREHMPHPRAQLVDQLDDTLAVATHLLVSFAASGRRTNRTRSSPSSIEAPAVSRRAST